MFYGWYVVGCAFLVAVAGFGFGFYGPALYLVSLHARHGWPIALISSAITVYFIVGAVLTAFVGDVMRRFGPRSAVLVGCLAMAGGVMSLSLVEAPWQMYVAFMAIAVGWASMNGAAISTMVAPWFTTKRGLAISLALNGGSVGGVVVTPLLMTLVSRYGFRRGLGLALATMLAVLVPVVLVVLGRRSDDHGGVASNARLVETPWPRRSALHDRAFLTIAGSFVLGFVAQVGFLTHQISYLLPVIGRRGTALAVSMTAIAAIVGRTATGTFVNKVDRRLVASGNFLLQAAALAILLGVEAPLAVYVGCVVFGLAVGNMNTLPVLIVQQEFAPEHFGRVVSLAVGVNQLAFAIGPALLGALHDWSADYRMALGTCLGLDALAALIVLWGRRARSRG